MSALSVEGLRVVVGRGRRSFPAVDEVTLSVPPGKVLGLVGESGSGKSTLARAVVGLHPIQAGRLSINGEDVTGLRGANRANRLRAVQMIFQDTYGSLNPRMTIAQIVSEGIRRSESVRRADMRAELIRLLGLVSLDERHLDRYPRELSGGQRQRVAIARVLATGAPVIIADEITSALDVSVQAQVLNLLREIVQNNNLSMLFISHNLAVVNFICDSVAVMHSGRIVETAPTPQLFGDPHHPYTRALLAAVPSLRVRAGDRAEWISIGEPIDPHHPPTGCRFHPQCPIGPLFFPERVECTTVDPRIGAADRPHGSACHFAAEIAQPIREER